MNTNWKIHILPDSNPRFKSNTPNTHTKKKVNRAKRYNTDLKIKPSEKTNKDR